MRAWLFQDSRQRKKLGADARWSVGWIDPDGKRRSKTIGSKSKAEKFRRKVEGELAAGTYQQYSQTLWIEFEVILEERVLRGMEPGTREATKYALKHFRRIVKPQRMRGITSAVLADYVAKRRQERRTKAENAPLISPATVNKELRTLRSILRKAVKWGYLGTMPEIEFLREPRRLPRYVTPEHFALIYGKGCEAARWPDDQPYAAEDWWRAVLMMAYMTGWRIGSLLALRWEDVDLDEGHAVSRAADNKGRRDDLIPLHPVVIDHLQGLKSFSPMVFPWNHSRRKVFSEFGRLQMAAGISLPGEDRPYGFHDLRRAFATMNAENLTPDVLQKLMQHRDYQTTQRYINMARQLKPAIEKLFIPKVTRPKRASGN